MNDSFADARLSNTGDGPGPLRLWPIVIVVFSIFTLFIGRLFQLQILEGEALASRSQANSVRTVRLEAQRGTIVDREGRTIAASRPAYGVDLIPYEIRNPWRTYSVLGAILDRDPSEIAETVGQPRRRRRFQPVSLSKDLSLEERAQIAAHRYAMPGVALYEKPLREYIYGNMAAQLLGTLDVKRVEVSMQLDHLADGVRQKYDVDLQVALDQQLDAELDVVHAAEQVSWLKERLAKLGEVNTGAVEEYEEVSKRFDFLSRQKVDLLELAVPISLNYFVN